MQPLSNQVEFLGLSNASTCSQELKENLMYCLEVGELSRSIGTLKYFQKEACKTKIVPALRF